MDIEYQRKTDVEGWFDSKKKFVEMIKLEWEHDHVPILIVVVENTASIFHCVVYDYLAELIKRPYDIFLCHSWETHLINSFKEKHKVFYEDEFYKQQTAGLESTIIERE